MICLHCKHSTSKDAPMSRQGFGRCVFHQVGRYVSVTFERECGKFAALPDPEIAARDEWQKRNEAREK